MPGPENPLRRRAVLRNGALGLAGVAGAGLLTFTASQSQAATTTAAGSSDDGGKPTKRLAIIGAGAAGVSTAYFCDSGWNIDLFESRDKIGGHADTIEVTDGGKKYSVDIGAEFFHPNTHPLYWSFLEEIGARTDDDNSKVIEGPASLTVFNRTTGDALFGSDHAIDNLPNALTFLSFTGEARKMTDPDSPWTTTMGEWLDGLDIDADFKKNTLTPWLASLTCGDTELLRTQSARAHLSSFAKTFPKTIFEPVHTYNSTIGLQGYLQLLLDACKNTSVLTRAGVKGLTEKDGAWTVHTDSGTHGTYDAIVVTAPPHISKDFFGDAAGYSKTADLLAKHKYHPARLVIHRDPHYMPTDKSYWSVQNAAAGGRYCETSIWVGDYYDQDSDTHPSIFKSWAAYRDSDPTEILAERKFQHPLCTPDSLGAARDLMTTQGKQNLYFAGSWTTVTDLQETSLFSAMKVANALNAEGDKLTSFKKRLADGNLGDVSYEVA